MCASHRNGFTQLTAQVAMSRVGIVPGLEVSRLARNNADWYQLLDLCAMSDTLIGDAEPSDRRCRSKLSLHWSQHRAVLYGKRWRHAKLKGLAVAALVGGGTALTTQVLKSLTSWTRPNEEDEFGFPSGHASNSSAMSTLSNRQLNSVNLPPLARKSIQVTNFALASLTADARMDSEEGMKAQTYVPL